MWEETLVFNIQMPQIALVRFQVWDHDPIGRDFIGQRTVAFTSMMPGRLHNMQSLCVHVLFLFVFFKISSEVRKKMWVSLQKNVFKETRF